MCISRKTNITLLLLATGCTGAGLGCAQTAVSPQAASAETVSVPAAGSDSRYVAVDLNALGNDESTLPLQGGQSVVDNVPFNPVTKEGKGNLFLRNAGWPDWKQDPLDFYAAYDAAGVKNKFGDVVPVAQVPVDDYSAVYVLVSCENDAAYSNVLALRIGVKSSAQTTYHDYEFVVPRRNEQTGENVVKVIPTPQGNAFLLRLPLNGSFSQPFEGRKMLDVEITKKLRLAVSKPDAARFQHRPLGLPSGVRLYGMTFERAPVRFSLQGAQPGQVFNDPEVPTFALQLKPQGERQPGKLTLRARATDYYGKEIDFPVVAATASANSNTQLKFPVTRRGYYLLNVTLEEDGKVLLKRQTSFALLPKDTRKHRDRSPFGTWDFTGAHYTPKDADVMGPLYVKAGLRYGMFNYPEEVRQKYGVLQGQDPTMFGATSGQRLDNIIAGLKKNGTIPERFMVFHEDNISGNQIMRVPSIFTGFEYELNEGEQKKFKSLWDAGVEGTAKMRKEYPGIGVYFGNAVPHILEPFLKNKYPAELIDYASNEAASFQRPPETQPTEFISNNASIWMGRKLLDSYGYQDVPMGQCYEVIYTSTNPGNLTLSEQANYTVRNIMHSLAWKIPIIRFQGIADIGNSYYYGNWGGVGLLNALPNLSPKPLYVATATMTQMLDGADFTRIIPTGSTTVYAFEFKKPDGGFVTCLWTPNAPRNVSLKNQGALTVTDLMSNQQPLQQEQGVFKMVATQAPVFIESAQPLQVEIGASIAGAAPQGKKFPISALSDVNQWQVEQDLNLELSSYNFMQPRLNAPFEVKNVAEFEGEANPLQVKPLKPETEKWWLPQYTRLKMKQPVTVEGQPTHVGLMVNGNGGWGRVVFEFEDAAGQRWSSLGAELPGGEPNPLVANYMSQDEFKALKEKKTGGASVSDWNSNDVWGRSMINFAGWRYMQFPLPGNYPGEGYHWPYTSQWRCLKADGTRGDYVVHYPLKFTGLAVTARSKVLYGTQEVPVDRPEIYLKDLGVTYGDPDTVFWKPDPGQK